MFILVSRGLALKSFALSCAVLTSKLKKRMMRIRRRTKTGGGLIGRGLYSSGDESEKCSIVNAVVMMILANEDDQWQNVDSDTHDPRNYDSGSDHDS